MRIIAIETSCDETAAAIIQQSTINNQQLKFDILSNVVLSQIKIHRKTGGIVPEVAARNHILNMIPVIDKALKEAKVNPKNIDCIAVTRGPGLITSLMVGVETAKSLAYAWDKPIVGINHLKGHIYSAWIPSANNQQSTIDNQNEEVTEEPEADEVESLTEEEVDEVVEESAEPIVEESEDEVLEQKEE